MGRLCYYTAGWVQWVQLPVQVSGKMRSPEEKLRTDFSMKCAHLEMYVCGDFNYDPNGFRQEFFRTSSAAG